MKKLLLTLLALAVVSGTFARRRGGRGCGPCKTSCAPCVSSCAPRCPMPEAPKGPCLPQAQCSDSCVNGNLIVPCEAWAVVEAKQPVKSQTNVVTTTTYAYDGCPFIDDSCLSKDKIRLGEGAYAGDSCGFNSCK